MFFGFFLLQGLLVGLLSTPFAIVLSNPRPGFGPWEIAGTALWLVGFFGEMTADAQLRRFRSDPANAGGVCAVGLWRYSRHPNYFFEWVIWIAYFVFALGSPGGWLAVICPLIMWHFLVNVTGIPPAEEQSLKSRGDAYRAYQQTTSPFIPWLPRRQP
jgi:steroid 5-alpha reductase family enzyme